LARLLHNLGYQCQGQLRELFLADVAMAIHQRTEKPDTPPEGSGASGSVTP
jgi:hypothetical protein